MQHFIEVLYQKEKAGIDSFGALYSLKSDYINHQYNLILISNGRARQSPMMYSYLFLSQRIELIAALVSMIFVVIVSVYMILQALHLITDDDIRIPPAVYLQWLYMLKVIIDLVKGFID